MDFLFLEKITFLIDDDGKINSDKLFEFEKKYKNEKKIIFGFTFNIYK